MKSTTHPFIKTILGAGCFAAILIMLLPLFDLRPYADDFDMLRNVQANAWQFMVSNYYGWSGRWAYFLLYGLLGQLPIPLWGWSILGFVGLWWIGYYRIARLHAPRSAALGASLLLLTSLQAITAPQEVIWWLSGFYTYLIALVLATWIVVLWQAPKRPLRTACLLALVFMLPAFNDVTGPLQLLAWSSLLLWAAGHRRSLRQPLICLLVALVGYALVFVAPGNAIRLSYFTHPPYFAVVQAALRQWGHIPAQTITRSALIIPLALCLMLAAPLRHRSAEKALGFLLLGVGLCIGTLVVGYGAAGNLIPERAWSSAEVGFILCSIQAGRYAIPDTFRHGTINQGVSIHV